MCACAFTMDDVPLMENVEGDANDGFQSGSRWSRHETLALLRLRSEMDLLFKDCNVKAPLWEDVSRKLADLGYKRSAKKCKEKFENIYKYHKRTKGGRSDKPSAKSYRFFDQLEALSTHNFGSFDKTEPNLQVNDSVESTSVDDDSSSGESQGERKGKCNLTDFVESLMARLIQKQESLQQKFLDALEKRERDRIARDEAWRTQELDRIKRECELLAQERSIQAAKDAAMLQVLQKLTGQQVPIPSQFPDDPKDGGRVALPGECSNSNSNPVRWPNEEIEALIRLRTTLDVQYQENSPKGPLWEEISSEMRKLGFERSAKRCKEKWENMNKYFKRVKESKKRRPEDSRTCPYFNQLDAIYRDKTTKYEHGSKNGSLLMSMMEVRHQGSEDQESENIDNNHEDGDGFPMVACDPSFGFIQC